MVERPGKRSKVNLDNADNVSNKEKAEAGNSRSYTVSRLQRESPALFAQVGVNLFFTLALTQKNFAPRGLSLRQLID